MVRGKISRFIMSFSYLYFVNLILEGRTYLLFSISESLAWDENNLSIDRFKHENSLKIASLLQSLPIFCLCYMKVVRICYFLLAYQLLGMNQNIEF